MSKNTAKLKVTPESVQANSAIIRIEENQYMHLVRKLTMTMAEYQRHQSANEAFYKEQTRRQIKIKYTNPDGSAIDDTTAARLAEQVMENNTSSYIFQQSKEVLASIIETRNDIYRIEQSMRDLNQLFNDLAFLVNEQGELMDVILANIQRSTRYVEKSRAEVKRLCMMTCRSAVKRLWKVTILWKKSCRIALRHRTDKRKVVGSSPRLEVYRNHGESASVWGSVAPLTTSVPLLSAPPHDGFCFFSMVAVLASPVRFGC
ncbi:hypothetical protein LSCM1_03171 [Leishmania martiniquensis]|uniref:t-SNARE coiled-coil homology domain-containing protein n=1 Tax=Leishmania martiniquensis TaxID=1580590 RepID=A0A836GYQ6_9TRYP|nr:hypothetical protein LSCM1_03171 [Leishmania martiniquensis]